MKLDNYVKSDSYVNYDDYEATYEDPIRANTRALVRKDLADALNHLQDTGAPLADEGNYFRGYKQALKDVAKQMSLKTRTEFVA
jgi:hypothetical protein